jgi:NADPH2:quinone reductase
VSFSVHVLTTLAWCCVSSVIATVGSAEKAALAKEAGADHVINYNEVDFAPEVRKLTNGVGVNVVFGEFTGDNAQS